MKKLLAVTIIGCLTFSFVGCGKSNQEANNAQTSTEADGTETVLKEDETDYAALNENVLPLFSYNTLYSFEGYDSMEAAAYDYLSFDYDMECDGENVIIPYVDILGADDTNADDVLVYGNYYLWQYTKNEDTIEAVSGGSYPGVIHMEMIGDKDNALYSANSFDEGLTDEDTKEIMGDYYDAYIEANSDQEKIEAEIAQVLADYVSANNLQITKYKMFGQDAKELPASHAGVIPPDINYGSSELYTIEEMDEAIALIYDEFYTWEGCELHSIEYAGDECNNEENLEWANSMVEGQNFTQYIEFTSSFHSPVEGGGAWEPDEEYEDYKWSLARADGGEWQLISWGYA